MKKWKTINVWSLAVPLWDFEHSLSVACAIHVIYHVHTLMGSNHIESVTVMYFLALFNAFLVNCSAPGVTKLLTMPMFNWNVAGYDVIEASYSVSAPGCKYMWWNASLINLVGTRSRMQDGEDKREITHCNSGRKICWKFWKNQVGFQFWHFPLHL